jgi:hypothetical protein
MKKGVGRLWLVVGEREGGRMELRLFTRRLDEVMGDTGMAFFLGRSL